MSGWEHDGCAALPTLWREYSFTAENAEDAEMTERGNLDRIIKNIIGALLEVHRALDGLAFFLSPPMKPV